MTAKVKKINEPSELELQFRNQLRGARIPDPKTEYMFHDIRKWRLDFAWPEYGLAVEIHGATHAGGRHSRGKGMREDRIKMAEAILAGWTVFEFTGDMVKDNEAVHFICRFFEQL